jgi:MinD-like ATPase involved in chromosome partitioning or flagellar assembly
MVLGSLLATVRGEPVLALDGAASDGALDGFLTGASRNPATLRDVAALPPDSPYEDLSAHTTRLDSGLEVIAHRSGHFSANPAHAHQYAQVLERAAPYYSFVLTDWSPLRLDRSADFVLALTDRLVLCCGTAEWSLDAAAHTLHGLRSTGHVELVDRAIVVVTEVEGAPSHSAHPDLAGHLGIRPGQVSAIPFDLSLRSPGFRELGRLRATTTQAFLTLAQLVVEDATH